MPEVEGLASLSVRTAKSNQRRRRRKTERMLKERDKASIQFESSRVRVGVHVTGEKIVIRIHALRLLWQLLGRSSRSGGT